MKKSRIHPTETDTFALAQHLTGDTHGAIDTEKKAISLVPPGPSALRSALGKSLTKYETALDKAQPPVETDSD